MACGMVADDDLNSERLIVSAGWRTAKRHEH